MRRMWNKSNKDDVEGEKEKNKEGKERMEGKNKAWQSREKSEIKKQENKV